MVKIFITWFVSHVKPCFEVFTEMNRSGFLQGDMMFTTTVTDILSILIANKLRGSDILPDDFVFIMGIFLFL